MTEIPCERPQKKKQWYSGKKKRHTLKAQLLVHALTRQIICTATGSRAIHDFMLFKQSRTYVHPETQIKADAGYQGIQQGHALTQTPKRPVNIIP
ncbi:transposase family protein [Deinococcus cavernae]|uniref:transposase family protein n=1 Tax=Deinococcus cavernae TaxID=2320857 RepID=UPI003B75C84E